MKRLSLLIVCALALFITSCQKADNRDINGNTPTKVVEMMYNYIQNNDYESAADCCKIPESVDDKVYATYAKEYFEAGEAVPTWKEIVIKNMVKQGDESGIKLVDFKVISEEISKTDPNNANVKTVITIIKNDVQSEAECSFPLKREENVWRIIG